MKFKRQDWLSGHRDAVGRYAMARRRAFEATCEWW
jgi:hypothetical protein